MARHKDTPAKLAESDVSSNEETLKGPDRLQYTTEQLLNIKLEADKTDQENIANIIKGALMDTGVKAPDVEQPRPSVTFATTTENPEGPEDPEEDDEGGEELMSGGTVAIPEDKPKKKKKKKKSSGKNRLPPPTGFEEFYADPPMTPQEHEEDRNEYYRSELSFIERIETCIQNYRTKRKLNSERSDIFTKFLLLGGIDAGMKPFSGGLDKDLLANSSKDEIARFAATDYIGTNNIKFYDAANSKDWVVDFEGVVKGFLSHRASRFLGFATKQQVVTCCGVIRNFLNYVLVHEVCPEYTQQIMSSKIICDKAEKELWAIRQIGPLLPGSFNIACSTLYGGFFKGMYVDGDSSSWGPTEEEYAKYGPHFTGMPHHEAESIVKIAVTVMGNEEMSKDASGGTIHVVKEETQSFEVVEIVRADSKISDAFAGTKVINSKLENVKPLGIMRVKPFDNPDCDEEDCSDDGAEPDITYDIQDFWIEDYILEQLFIGLKIKASVHELDNGFKYFDTINGLYCSFLTILPNEKMENWRDPSLSTRPPPTVENPNISDEIEDIPHDNDDNESS